MLQNEHLGNDSPVVTFSDIESCIGNLKRNKAAGSENIISEHVIFGGPSLNVLVTCATCEKVLIPYSVFDYFSSRHSG